MCDVQRRVPFEEEHREHSRVHMYKHTTAHVHSSVCIEENRLLFARKSPYHATVATVTLHVPVTAVERRLLILNLIYTQSKHPSSPLLPVLLALPPLSCVCLSSSTSITQSVSLTHFLLLPFGLLRSMPDHTVFSWQVWKNAGAIPTDNHTLPRVSPSKLWQAWHRWGNNLITSVSHHTLWLQSG